MSKHLLSSDLELMQKKAPEVAELMRIMSNPTRLMLLCDIAHRGESSVAELERDLGIKQPGLSQHLAELRQSELVSTRRESRSIFYSIADTKVHALLDLLRDLFCNENTALDKNALPAISPSKHSGDVAIFSQVKRR
jgi:DNA-binding transcriptional ArsR family regulator